MVGMSLPAAFLIALATLEHVVMVAPEECSTSGELRLSGGLQGRVEVCMAGEWGTVCSGRDWGVKDASVVCRQLQHSQLGSAVKSYGGGSGPIHLAEVGCSGSETVLLDCPHNNVSASCTHDDDAGVVCLKDGCIHNSTRLVDGESDSDGRVQFCHRGTWGEVCGILWNNDDASVVCRQLGRGSSGRGSFPSAQVTRPVILDAYEFSCTGNEQQLIDCAGANVDFYKCGEGFFAHVECLEECTKGDVRLMDGSSDMNGRVEVCEGGQWEPVCNSGWDDFDASVVCRQLNISEYGFAIESDGVGTDQPVINNMQCAGSEARLVDCQHTTATCPTSPVAGVTCFSDGCTDNDIRLDPGSNHLRGKVEICAKGVWGSICSVPKWNESEASVVCRQLGHGAGGTAYLARETSRPTFLEFVSCTGNESNLLDCDRNGDVGLHTCTFGFFAEVECPRGSECVDGEVRLAGGPNNLEGRVEVCIGGKWGTICSYLWGDVDASVVCKQLGFGNYGIAVRDYGNGTGNILFEGVQCSGSERYLLNCSRSAIGEHRCETNQEAGVTCLSDGCSDGDVRLVGGESEYQGRVQFCHGGTWGEICAPGDWRDSDASVVCKQLGYRGGISSFSKNTSVTRPSLLEGIHCTGDETHILDCPDARVDLYPCRENYYAEACCLRDNCTTGDIRLVGGRSESEGRVEVCDENTWATVCNDGWDGNDAFVVCKQLGYEPGGSIAIIRAGFEEDVCSRRIIMNDVNCTGDENQLTDCPSSDRIGSCEHHDDVGVVCNTGAECPERTRTRLTNGTEGRVEICMLGVWGTICDFMWDDKDATVVCNELGLSPFGEAIKGLEGGKGPIFKEGLSCEGDERFIATCHANSADSEFYTCTHQTDAGVRCLNETDIVPTTILPNVSMTPTVAPPTTEHGKGSSDDNTAILVGSITSGVFLLLLIVCVITMIILLNFMNTSRKITRLKRHVTTVELLHGHTGTLRSLPEDPLSPMETDIDQKCLASPPPSATHRYLHPPGSAAFISGPVIASLIPPRPPSPITSAYLRKLTSHMLIPSSQIRLLDCIGQGEFGIVYKAHLLKPPQMAMRSNVDPQTVAIKTLKGCYDQTAIHSALDECVKMKGFDHPNVLCLLGVCVDAGPSPYVVMPYMANGSLLAFLKKERETLLLPANAEEEMILEAQKRLLNMCSQIAKGMEYLAEKKFVHRDLAARNCMIDTQYIIKVSDFGLSEDLYAKNYFRQDKDTVVKLPVKWMAPESLTDGLFTEKTDVWSFGVTCWEVFSAGKMPYPGIDPSALIKMLESGDRLEKPSNSACSDAMYGVMRTSWYENPDKRPTFSELSCEIANLLTSLAGYLELETITGILCKSTEEKKRVSRSVRSADFSPALGVDVLSKQDILTPVGIAIHLDPTGDTQSGGFSPQMERNGFKLRGSVESLSSCGSEVAAIMSDKLSNIEAS